MSDPKDEGERPKRAADDRRPSSNRAGRAAGSGDRRPSDRKPNSGERKPWADRKPASAGDGKPRSSDRKPASAGDRKAWSDRKPGGAGERKPWSNDRKPAGAERRGASADRAPRSGERGGAGDRGRGGSAGRGAASTRGVRDDRGRDEQRLWTKGGAPARGDRDAREREPEIDRDPFGTRSVRPRHDDPEVPDSVTAKDLDRIARNELKTLTAENQDWVARHLVMAARLIDEDPQLAHRHAISASRKAGRIGIARETLAITAYAIGDYALALRELRTYRRITGRDDQLPMMVDSERGLGRPERALELGRSVPRASLPVPVQVELAIAMSGARLDLGDPEAALRELEIPQLDASTAYSYSPGLFDAYALVLDDLGRTTEAQEWNRRADIAAEALGQAEDGDDLVEITEEEFQDDDTPEEQEFVDAQTPQERAIADGEATDRKAIDE